MHCHSRAAQPNPRPPTSTVAATTLSPCSGLSGSLSRFRSLRAMTEFFVIRYTEFPDLVSYLRGYAITGERLAALTVPSSILLADDDPVIPAASVARVARTPALTVHRTRWGGHCGFLHDYRLRTWSDDYLLRTLSA